MKHTLEIKGLVASVAGKQILNGIDLTVRSGEVHAIMGPNGAGKTTLSSVVMGRPGYEVLSGQVLLDGEDVLAMPAWRRAQAGLHLVMQYPSEVPGVMLADVMGEAFAARGRSTDGLDGALRREAEGIGFSAALLDRALNVDLSGGEKKRNETLQLAMLRPKFAILDETDSGLDVDAVKLASQSIAAIAQEQEGGAEMGILIITHHDKLLEHNTPDFTHVMLGGRIVETGGVDLARELYTDGYDRIRAAYPEAAKLEAEMQEEEAAAV